MMRAESLGSMLKIILVSVVLSFAVAAVTSCASVPGVKTNQESVESRTARQADARTWDEAMDAFQKKEYEKAAPLFESLSRNSESETLRQKALYGLACTRLILAHTQDELDNAVATWDVWNHGGPAAKDSEDPRLLTPLIERITHQEAAAGASAKTLNQDEKMLYKNASTSKDLATYKNLLQAKDRELERVKARLLVKEREVRHLKGQIDSLEAIHLKIQEKKKEISSP
jgi:hypothetical protein